MKIVLATGIYPPDIGGPATYVQELAVQLEAGGEEVRVVTYGRRTKDEGLRTKDQKIVYVSKGGGPFLRWWRYAKALRNVGQDADAVIAFSSVSAGVPLLLSRLKKPKRILRLGGDFLWERYTDSGGTQGLRDWYALLNMRKIQNSRPASSRIGRAKFKIQQRCMHALLHTFDHIVFSTRMQEELYEEFYTSMPEHSVIENALPEGVPAMHQAHAPFRLLFLGRIVAVKNLASLLTALQHLPDVTLTVAGEGPLEASLTALAQEMHVLDRVFFIGPKAGAAKQRLFAEHDLLVLPSFSEVSPHAALEARAVGLPVLLTVENGLSFTLRDGIVLQQLCTPSAIVQALRDVRLAYDALAARAAAPLPPRGWSIVQQEYRILFHSLL